MQEWLSGIQPSEKVFARMFRKKDSPSDYCFVDTAPGYRLTPFERLTLTGGNELGRAVDWLGRQFSSISPRLEFGEVDVPAIQAAAQFYSSPRWHGDPGSFFELRDDLGDFKLVPVHGLVDGQILDIEFASNYRVRNPAYEAEHRSRPENLTVFARAWKHHTPGSATLLAIHGWTMGDQRLNSLAFLPGLFYDLGLDVVLIELPYHGRRRPSGAGQSFLFPDTNVVRVNEAIGQAISDLRQLRRRLEAIGFRNIGCVGMSLGGYVGSLWSSLDPLAFCIPVVPLVAMDEMFWSVLATQPAFERVKAAGLTLATLSQVFRVHSPLSFAPGLPPEKALIMAGIGDRIVPSKQPKQLWHHWGKPKLHRFTGGHVTHFGRSRAIRSVIEKLSELGYVSAQGAERVRASLPKR